MIAVMAMALQTDRPVAAMPAAPRIACTPVIVAANTPGGWRMPAAVASGATIVPARAVLLTLRPAATVAFLAPAAKPGAMAASVVISVPHAGRWNVSLDTPIWIDVISTDGKAAPSVGHAHGPVCSGIAKIVGFDLSAGRYVVQLSGAIAAKIRIMMAQG